MAAVDGGGEATRGPMGVLGGGGARGGRRWSGGEVEWGGRARAE